MYISTDCHVPRHSQNIKKLTVNVYRGGGLHDPGLGDSSVPDSAPVGGVVIFLLGHDGQDGPGGLRPVGAREVEGLQVGLLSVLVPEYLGRRGPAHAGAGEVEGLPLGDGGSDGLQPGRGGREEHHQLHRAGVELVPGPALHLTALEVPIVPVVGGVLDPQVVPAKVRLMIHPENKDMFQNSVFPSAALVPMIKQGRGDRLK